MDQASACQKLTNMLLSVLTTIVLSGQTGQNAATKTMQNGNVPLCCNAISSCLLAIAQQTFKRIAKHHEPLQRPFYKLLCAAIFTI